MKKLLALLLALAMIMSFAACGSTDSYDDDDDDKKTEETKKDKEPEEAEKNEPSRGTINGAVYTNTYLGLKFTRPESWVYATDEEIAQTLNLSLDAFSDKEKYQKALEENLTMYDMMVADITTRTNINVMLENLEKSNSTNITEDQYINAVKTQLQTAAPNMNVTFEATTSNVNLGETKFVRAIATVISSGVTMKQVYYVRKIDKYMAGVIVTIPSGYTVEQVEAMFS